jgi:hypothetical protein
VALRHALLGTDQVFTTGLVLQELLQGFAGPKDTWGVERDSSGQVTVGASGFCG